jgi:L-cysteine S-thiosulfotransferase
MMVGVRLAIIGIVGMAVMLAAVHAFGQTGSPFGIPAADTKSGREFLAPETQAQQDDLTINPGMLWVKQGEKLWQEAAGPQAKSCASCHDEPSSFKGVATRYPLYDARLKRLLNLEGRVENCRIEHQSAPALPYESQELLALTALVARQSLGLPMKAVTDGPARPFYEAGRAMFFSQQGQLNISCAQCHDDNWGKRLRADRLSQGQPNGFPAYRLEWQTMGSLHRRLRACFQGVRAEPFMSGAPEFVALELYLAARAQGLPIETPAVRR